MLPHRKDARMEQVSQTVLHPSAEEHRATSEWLDNKTDELINLFGIQVEAFKICDSLPAPTISIIA